MRTTYEQQQTTNTWKYCNISEVSAAILDCCRIITKRLCLRFNMWQLYSYYFKVTNTTTKQTLTGEEKQRQRKDKHKKGKKQKQSNINKQRKHIKYKDNYEEKERANAK